MATGGVVEGSGRHPHKDRPTGLPTVPKIFLNTTSRDRICLLPPDARRGTEHCGPVCSAACGSSSLPNLTCEPDLVLEEQPGGRDRDGCCGGRDGMAGNRGQPEENARKHLLRRASGPGGTTKLSVYCSPRVSRRTFADVTASASGDSATAAAAANYQHHNQCHQHIQHHHHHHHHHPHEQQAEHSWMHNVAKFIKSEADRRESNSSVESDSSLRSASHVSTCATSEYTRFTSCDRLSLPVHDLSPSLPAPPGRLRRIFSNPEAPFLKEGTSGEMRDSKSCSDLKDHQSRSLVDHSDLERKLSTEASHLLSPPALMPTTTTTSGTTTTRRDGGAEGHTGVTPLQVSDGVNIGGSPYLPVLGSPPPVEGWQDRVVAGSSGLQEGGSVSRDLMIREWLQGVDPAIVVTNDYGTGAGAGAFATS